MDDVWTLVRWLHLLAVATWLGGMIFLGAVVVPVVRASGGIARSRELVTAVGRRFGVVGGIAWATLLVTGLLLLDHRNVSVADLTDSDYGRRVLTKLVLLLLIGVVVVLHATVQGPRVRRAEAAGDDGGRRRWQIVGGVMDAFMLLASLAALWLGASLVA
jgi:putative copper export protein